MRLSLHPLMLRMSLFALAYLLIIGVTAPDISPPFAAVLAWFAAMTQNALAQLLALVFDGDAPEDW